MKVDINFSRLFSKFFSSLKITVLLFPFDGDAKELFFHSLSPKDLIVELPAHSYLGDLDITEPHTLIFDKKTYDEFKGSGSCTFVANRPKNIAFIWKLTYEGEDFFVFDDLKLVDHHIIKLSPKPID